MTMRSWIRSIFARPVIRPIRKGQPRIRLGIESLEERLAPAGGLLSTILGDGAVRIQADAGEMILVQGATAADTAQLVAYFSASDGSAGTVRFEGSLTVGGEAVAGAFEFSEVGVTGGIEAIVANATVRLGETVGIELTGASGAFVLVSTGAAGALTAADGPADSEVAAFGLPGLNVKSAGLTFELDTTGGTDVRQLSGPAAFVVSGASSPVVRVAGAFVMTEDGDGLALAGEQVGVDLYAGDLRVITLGSATAGFTLTEEAFALDEGSFTVGGFMILPQGEPTAPGEGNYSEDQLTISANLGPLAIEELGLVFDGLTFARDRLSVDVGLSAASASLEFSAASAVAEGLLGTFEIAGDVDPETGVVGDVGASGGFAISADSFSMEVPGLLTASAEGLTIQYDPSAEGPQELITADAVTIEVPKLKLLGEFESTDEFPAMQIRTDGFAFGKGTVTYTGTIAFGPADDPTVAITDPFVSLENFNFSTSTGLHVGGVAIGAAEVVVSAAQGKFTGVGTDLELAIGLDDDSMAVESVEFTLGELELTYTPARRPGSTGGDTGGETGSEGEDEGGSLPPLLTLTASNIAFNPLADEGDNIFSVEHASATVFVAGITLTGEAGAMAIGADGSFSGPDTLRIGIDFTLESDEYSAQTATQFQWPTWLPVRLREVALEWDNFAENPTHFVIDVSAAIDGSIGPLTLSGGVDHLVLDPFRLAEGKSPLVSLDGFSVGIGGTLFGAGVSGALAGGILILDSEGNIVDEAPADEEYETVFYGGLNGSIDIPGVGGFEVLVGFSERGLLQAYFRAGVPVLIEPLSGLTLSDFRGGLTFNASPLETPSSPAGLQSPEFQPTLDLEYDVWQQQLKQAVANQVSGGSRIFSLEEGVDDAVDELDSGEVAAGGVLHAAFDENGYAVADEEEAGAVEELVPGEQWLVSYQGNRYVLVLDDGVLDVTQAAFVIPAVTEPPAEGEPAPPTAAEVAEALGGGGQVQQVVIDAFLAADVMLSTNATVSVVAMEDDEPVKWKIIDGDAPAYFVTVRGGVLAVTGGGGSYDALDSVIKIEAGATLYSAYITKEVFNVDVDLLITTDGKFMVFGEATLGETLSVDLRLFADLSAIDDENPEEPVKFLFLGNFPSVNSGLPLVAQVEGELSFEFLDLDGNLVNPIFTAPSAFRLDVLGRAEFGAIGYGSIVFGGASGPDGGYASLSVLVENRPEVFRVQFDASGTLGLGGLISAEELVAGAGTLTIEKTTDGPLEIFGAVKLDADTTNGLNFLRDAGITADAELLVALNTSTETKDVELVVPGREPETLRLQAATLALEGEGSLRFAPDFGVVGAEVAFDGAFSARISVDVADDPSNPDPTVRGDLGVDLDLFVVAKVDVGLQVLGTDFNWLKLDGMGLIAIRDIGARVGGQLLTPQIAGRVDLFLERSVEGVFEAQGSVQLLMNTLGEDFIYVIPERLQDRLQIIQARRDEEDPDQITLPALPAIDGQLAVIVPGGAPLLDGTEAAPGPYVVLQFGDVGETTAPGGPADPDGDGLVDVSLTILDAFRLEGDFRILVSTSGLELDVSANASVVLPGAGDIFDAEAKGKLLITQAGLFGAIGLQADFNIPGIEITGEVFLGINTTSQEQVLDYENSNLPDRTILPQSAEVYVGGTLIVGPLELNGRFRLLVGAEAISLEVDSSFEFFNIPLLEVHGMAAIYYGRPDGQNGLVIDASVTIGGGGKFGVPRLFEIGGQLRLQLDTRPQQERFELALSNGHISLLDALTVDASARIVVERDDVGETYFRVEGDFRGSLLEIITVSASGFFDSRGYFALNINGHFQIGSDDWGIRADGHMFIERSEEVPLDFGASLSAELRAFGITLLGASINVDYAGYGVNDPRPVTGRISVGAEVDVLFVHISLGPFTVGYLLLDPSLAPELGHKDGNTLRLHVGAAAALRAAGKNEDDTPVIDEAYTIDSLGAGTDIGEKIRVRAFGSTQVFDNVTAITGDFGSGRDQVTILPRVGTFRGVSVNLAGGAGDDLMINQSPIGVTFDGGAGNDLLLGGAGDDVLSGGDGSDVIAGGAGLDQMRGGDGDDTLNWQAGRGIDPVIDGGAGIDTLVVSGSAADEQFTVSTSAGQTSIAVTGGAVPETILLTAEKLQINGQGGADTVTLPVGVVATGLTDVTLDLSRAPGSKIDARGNLPITDDGAADTVTVVGTAAGETFATTANGSDVQLTGGGLTVHLLAPAAATDTLTVRAGAGNDTLTATRAAGALVKTTLLGEGGDDTFRLPIGGAVSVVGGAGSNAAVFTVAAGDSTAISVTSDRVSSVNGATTYAGLAEVAVEASVPAASVNVQSTHANSTRLQFTGSVAATVQTTSGPLALTGDSGSAVVVQSTGGTAAIAVGGHSTVTLESTGAATTVSGVPAGGDRLLVGTGLLSRIGGSVAATNVDTVVYDDSLDGVGCTFGLTGSALTGTPAAGELTHTNARAIDLRLGLGDDTANVAVTPAAVTVTGNAGSDRTNITLAGEPAPGLDAAKYAVTTDLVEAVTFTSTGNTAATAWALDVGRLTTGTRNLLDASGGTLVLDQGPARQRVGADRLDVTTSQGTGSTFTADEITVPTAVTFGGTGNTMTVGSDLDLLDADLTLAGLGAGRLVFDDQASLDADDGRQRRFEGSTVTDPRGRALGTIRYSGFDTVEVLLGAAHDVVTVVGTTSLNSVSGGDGNDTFTVSGALGALQVNGGVGNDTFTVSGALGALQVNGDGGDDTLTLRAGSGNVSFDGGADTDQVTLDQHDAATNLTAEFSAPAGATTATVTGLPTLTVPAGSTAAERVILDLGSGNDTATFTNSGLITTFEVYGNQGDDTLRVNDLLADPASYELIGGFSGSVADGGFDTVSLEVHGVPAAPRPGSLSVSAEDLIIDNRANAAGAVAWQVGESLVGTNPPPNRDTISANGIVLLSATGADRISILGGMATGDTLVVTNQLPNRDVDATITDPTGAGRDGRIEYTEGLRIATQAGDPLDGFALGGATVNGLDGVRAVAAAPNGQYVYAAGSQGQIVISRRAGSSFEFVGSVASGTDVRELAISPDGMNLYSVHRRSNDTWYVSAWALDPTTGGVAGPTTADLANVTNPIDLHVDPQGWFVILVAPQLSGGGFVVKTLSREAFTDGVATFSYTGPAGSAPTAFVFNASGTQLHVTLSDGSIVSVDREVTTGVLSLRGVIESNPGITAIRGTKVEVSDDGKLLFVFSPSVLYRDGDTGQFLGEIRYYQLAGQFGGAPIRQLGAFPIYVNENGTPNEVFHYFSSTGVLAHLDRNEATIGFTEAKRLVTRKQDSSGVFQIVDHHDLIQIAFAGSMDGGTDSQGTTYVSLALYPHVGLLGSGISSIRIDPNGNIATVSAFGLLAAETSPAVVNAGNGTRIVAGGRKVVGSTPSLGDRVLRLMNPATGTVADYPALNSPASIGRFADIVPHPTLSNRFFTLEDDGPIAVPFKVRAYQIVVNAGQESIQLLGSTGLDGVGWARLNIDPASGQIYVLDNSGTIARLPLSLGSPTYYDSQDTNFNAFDLAFGNGRTYAVSSTRDEIAVFGPEGLTPSRALYSTGFNAFALGSATGIASSADGSQLYVATGGNQIVTLAPLSDGSDALVQATRAGADFAGFRLVGGSLYGLVASGQVNRYPLDGSGIPGAPVSTPVSAGAVDFDLANPAGDGSDFLTVVADLPTGADRLELYNADFSTGVIDPSVYRISQGNGGAIPVPTLTATTVSATGAYYYGVSAETGALVSTSADGTRRDVFIDGIGGVNQIAGAAYVAVGPNAADGSHYVAVGSRTEQAVSLFQRLADGTLQFVRAISHADFATLADLAFFDDGTVYAAVGTSQLLHIDADGTVTAVPVGLNADRIEFEGGRTYLYSEPQQRLVVADGTPSATVLQQFDGLAGVVDLAFAATSVYALSQNGVIYQFSRSAPGAALTGPTELTDGGGELTGLTGASAIEVSADGAYVFVGNDDQGSVTVYTRDAATGSLALAQHLRDGRGGVSGLTAPIGLAFRNDKLVVGNARGTVAGLDTGGFTVFNIADATLIDLIPARLVVEFATIEGVSLITRDGNDTVRVAPGTFGSVNALTIDTGAGADSVNVQTALTGSRTTTVSTGAGTDTVTVDRSDSGGTLSVVTGADADTVYLRNIGSGSTSINTTGDPAVADVVFATGSGVPAGTSVSVTGDLRDGTAVGDALVYDITGGTFNPPNDGVSSGALSLTGFGSVSFNGFNYSSNPAVNQVFPNAAPRPQIASPLTITEGQSVTLAAIDTVGGAVVGLDWDLNGDGVFTDAHTDNQGNVSVTLNWAALRALGIDDSGTYRVTVRASRAIPLAQFGGRDLVLSGDATATLTVNNAAPAVTLTADGTATLGTTYAVTFATTGDPGDDRVSGWTVVWGDGTTEQFGSTATGAAHVYTTPGDHTVTATATDEDGSYSSSRAVQARPGAASVSAGGPYTIDEGTGLTVTATAVGAPVKYEWNLPTGVMTTTTPTLTRTWAQLVTAGITDSGSYSFTVTAVYLNGIEYRGTSAAATLTVNNVAPTATLTATPNSVPAGSTAGAVTLSLVGLSDPADPITTMQADYDFDNNGTIDLANVPAAQSVNVPASFLTTPGPRTIRAVLRDEDGGARALFTTITVAEVPVAFTLAQVGTAVEGGTLSLTATVTSVGSRPVTEWVIEWGDGAVQTVAANGTGTQTFTHPYADDSATYPVVVTARNAAGEWATATSVVVSDVAPAVTLSTTMPTVTEGAANAFVLNVAVNDPGTDTVASYVIDWGDGTTDTVPGDVRDLTHTFADAPAGGTYSVRVTTITNEDGTFSNPSNTLSVTVGNAPPVIPMDLLRIPASSAEGVPFTLSAVARSVASGTEPLTFMWSVTAPGGQVTTFPAVIGEGFYTDAPTQFSARSSVTFTPADNGTYTVTLTVTDDDGPAATVTRQVQVENVSPVIDTFAVPATVTAGEVVALQATAYDPADQLTFTWVIIQQVTGATTTLTGPTVNFIPVAGDYSVQLTVTDGDGGIVTRIAALTVVNLPPVVQPGSFQVPPTGVEGGTATFSVAASDAVPGLTYEWRVEGPTGTVTTLSGAVVNYQWPDDGTFLVSVTVTDAGGATVTAGPASVAVANLAPTIISAATVAGSEGVSLTLTASATDPAGTNDALQYRWFLTGPGGQVFETSGATANFIPPDNGNYAVVLQVSDREGGLVSRSVGTIAVANVNPVVGAIAMPAGAIAEGATVTLSVPPATDVTADLTSLVYTWTITPPTGAPLTLTSREIQFVVPDNGTYAVRFEVTDGDGGSAVRTASLSVGNLAPVCQSFTVPAQGYVGFAVPMSAAFTDVASDPLTYTWKITRPGGGVTTLTGSSVAFTPAVSGSHAVELVVTDGDGGSVVRTAAFVVAATTVSLGRFDLAVGAVEAKPATFAAAATDAFGAAVTFTWMVTTPTGQTVTLTGANPTFTPEDDGSYAVTLTARSANGVETASGSFAVDNAPPLLTSLRVPGRVSLPDTVELSAAAADPAGAVDPLTYTWTVTRPDRTTFTLTGSSPTFTPAAPGFYGVRLAVTDGDGGEVTAQRTVAVINPPPAASTGGPYDVPEGGAVQLDALTGTTDANQPADTLTYAWDFDGDGVFGEASTSYGDERGSRPTFRATTLDGPTEASVRVRVTDEWGAIDVADAVVRVHNVAPVILTLGATSASENGLVTLSGTYSDVGMLDTHALTIDWGEGVPVTYAVSGGTFSFTHQYLDDNPTHTASDVYAIGVTLADDDTGTASRGTTTTISNVAPVILTLGATSANENGLVTLSGTYSDVGTLDTHALTIDWGEGVPVTYAVSGGTFSFTHQYLDDNPTHTASDVYAIGVTLADDDTGTASRGTTTTISNVAPVVSIAPTSPSAATQGLAFTIAGSFTDVGTLDTHTFRWTATCNGRPVNLVGVAGTSGVAAAGAPISISYTPVEHGTYVFTLAVTDDDGGVHTTSRTVAVARGTGTVQYSGRLIIYGTSCDDDIMVNPGFGAPEIKVKLNGAQSAFRGVTEVVIFANAGDDRVQIAGGVTLPVMAFGADGNDRMKAGGGDSVLVGGDGDDVLLGGAGRDVLIGGFGGDTIGGNGGDDVIVAGATDFDANLAALDLVKKEWVSDRIFADRVANLSGTGATGLNGAALLTTVGSAHTVHDDNAVDALTGDAGNDWFVFNSTCGAARDRATDMTAFEDLFDADLM